MAGDNGRHTGIGDNLRRGPDHPRWKGGRRKRKGGYVAVLAPGEPHVQLDEHGYVLEHVLVATRVLKKPLPALAVIHHVDEQRGNNRPDNLVICQDHSYHMLLHARLRAHRATGDPTAQHCPHCDRWMHRGDPDVSVNAPSGHRRLPTFRHRSCHAKYSRPRQRERRHLARQQEPLDRTTGVGASDAHDLLSAEPWGCRRRLAYSKRNVPPDFPVDNTGATLRGKRLEPVGIELYEEVTGRKVWPMREARHPMYPFVMAHPDGKIVADPKGPGIFEQKIPGEYAFRKYQKEGLPPAYIYQMQWTLGLTGYRWGAFSLFWPDGWKVLHFDVGRDRVVWEQLLESAIAFWREVENGPLPDPLPTDDPRCPRCPWRATCWGPRVMELSGRDAEHGDVVDAPELADVVADYLEAKENAKASDELVELIRDRLQELLAGREAVRAGKFTVYHRKQADGVILDEKTLKNMGKPKFVDWIYRRFGKPRRGAQPLRIV